MVTALLISVMINVILSMILYYYFEKIKDIKLDKEEEIIEIHRKAQQEIKKAQQEIEKTQQEAKKEISEIAKENSKLDRARLLAEEAEIRAKQDVIEAQRKMQIVLAKLLEKHKACIESNYKTLQALQSKYTKAIDLQIMRNQLSEKNRNKLLNRFEKLKKEITDEIQASEITQEIVNQAFEKIERNVK
jgi:hypothetical protein